MSPAPIAHAAQRCGRDAAQWAPLDDARLLHPDAAGRGRTRRDRRLSAGAIGYALVCVAMMGVMMAGMGHGHGDN